MNINPITGARLVTNAANDNYRDGWDRIFAKKPVPRTSHQWWEEVKANPEKMKDWLLKQYTGEVTAADRIIQLRDRHDDDLTFHQFKTLTAIANQERKHASWIEDLLLARGIQAEVGDPNARYWKETLKDLNDFETTAAIGAHAERMRLERIRVICEDTSGPEDIREVFLKILPEEEFHERAFAEMTTPNHLERTLANHEAGAAALGLVV